MPKQYEAIRDKFAKGAKKGSPAYDEAQSKAAAIFVGKGKTKKERSKLAKELRSDKTMHEKTRAMVDKVR
jgi:hypothetical protein